MSCKILKGRYQFPDNPSLVGSEYFDFAETLRDYPVLPLRREKLKNLQVTCRSIWFSEANFRCSPTCIRYVMLARIAAKVKMNAVIKYWSVLLLERKIIPFPNIALECCEKM